MKKWKLGKYSAKAMAVFMSGAVALTALPVHAASDGKKLEKEETVYVNAAPDGKTEKIIVSEWLKNHAGIDLIEDYTSLDRIENVKGDEEFTKKEDGSLRWKSDGSDIYYQGETGDELPVSMEVSYYLDGKKIDPQSLAGKSGKVKIRFDYYNHSSNVVNVGSKNYKVKTPFTMITAMILPTDVFSNVEVENGKAISDGDKNIVVGLAFPGLKGSLGFSSYDKLSDISIPDYVEVTADAEDFQLALTATVATTGTLNDLDTKDIEDAGDLKDDINKLTDASEQLADGTGELLDGMNTLRDSFGTYAKGVDAADKGARELAKGLKTLDLKKGELKDGVKGLSEGISTLKDGTETLKKGLGSYTLGVSSLEEGLHSAADGAGQLKEGSGALSKGLTDYTTGASALNSGIQSMAGELSKVKLPDENTLKAVNAAAKTLEEDAVQLSTFLAQMDEAVGGISQLNETLSAYQGQVEKARKALDSVDENATKQVQKQLREKVKTAKKMRDKIPMGDKIVSDGDIEGAISGIKVEGAAKEAEQILDAVLKVQFPSIKVDAAAVGVLLKDMKAQAQILEAFGGQSAELTNAVPKLTSGVKQLSEGSKTLTDGNAALLAGMKELDAGIDTLSGGLSQLTAGVSKLTANSEALNSGSSSLDSGASQLKAGSSKLEKGVDAYGTGVNQASQGAAKLSEGTKKLSDASGKLTDGIGKLADGASALDDGMNEFNKEGIQKISDLAGEDLENVVDRLKAVKEADKNYTSFGGMKDGTDGKVKFIIETGAIEK